MPPNIVGQIIKLLIALPLVILLAYVSLRLTSKYFYFQNHNKKMQVIERLSVNNKSSICIVKILDDYMVVGISENGFDLIKTLDDDEAETLEMQYEDPSKSGSFTNNLKKLIKGKLKHD